MAHAEPKSEEFDLSGELVIHKPTGATWGAREGAAKLHFFRRGTLGRTLANGDDYCPEEVAAIAFKLLAERIRPEGSALPQGASES